MQFSEWNVWIQINLYILNINILYISNVQNNEYNHELNTLKAIIKHPMATYGLNLSPILANFQNTPKAPVLFLFNNVGQVEWTYVHVHINNSMTWRSDWKLNNADCGIISILFLQPSSHKYIPWYRFLFQLQRDSK